MAIEVRHDDGYARTISQMTPEQIEIVAKLKEIEEQTGRLLDETPQLATGLARTRIVHIQNLAKYLRSTLVTELVVVKKNTSSG